MPVNDEYDDMFCSCARSAEEMCLFKFSSVFFAVSRSSLKSSCVLGKFGDAESGFNPTHAVSFLPTKLAAARIRVRYLSAGNIYALFRILLQVLPAPCVLVR